MGILIDPPDWPAHGRWWCHLVSDVSFAELHEFAARHAIPRRRFERDHYDVPAEMYAALVSAGATPVSAREVVRRLHGSGLRRRKSAAPAGRPPGRVLVRPPALQVGDVVTVPATSGVVPPQSLALGQARLESWGLRVRRGAHVLAAHPTLEYLAGSDEARAADFTDAWLDPDAAAVMVARGGFGSQRILDLLDWRRLAEAGPKLLIGFSDVTALHQAIAQRLGLVTLHGHVVTSLGSAEPASADFLRRLAMEPESIVDLLAGCPATVVVPGQATGVLTGGNLSLLAAEIGTRFSRSGRGGIVVLEDAGEPAYRVDRMLTQLLRAGWFDGVAGVVIGSFTDCGPQEEVDAVLRARLNPLSVPMVAGFDFGHTPTMVGVPFGVRAALDADRGTLSVEW
jgi:muramoyltetrapeptide carboxypeptidase